MNTNLKKTFARLSSIIAVVAVALVGVMSFVSCTDNPQKDILKAIPADAEMVMVGDITTIINSLGGSTEGSKITLPSYIKSELSEGEVEDFKSFNKTLEKSGVNINACALMLLKLKDNHPVIVAKVDDVKKLKSFIEDEGYKEKSDDNDLTIYKKLTYESDYDESYNNYSYIGLSKSYVYFIADVWVGSDFNPINKLETIAEDVKSGNFASTPYGKYISQGNAGGIAINLSHAVNSDQRDKIPSIMRSYLDKVICFKGDITNNSIEVEMQILDENGNAVTPLQLKGLDPESTINTKALSYMSKDDVFVAGLSLKNVDWDDIIETFGKMADMSRSDMAKMRALKGYLDMLDGTVAYGIGYTDDLNNIPDYKSEKNIAGNVSFTLVAELKAEKLQQCMNDITALLDETGIPYTNSNGCINISAVDQTGMEIYIKGDDNFLIFSTRKPNKGNNNTVAELPGVDNSMAFAAFTLNKSCRIMRSLGSKYDISCIGINDTKAKKFKYVLTIDGDDDRGALERLFRFGKQTYDTLDNISKEYDKKHYNSYDNDYWDADTVAVEEDMIAVDSLAY